MSFGASPFCAKRLPRWFDPQVGDLKKTLCEGFSADCAPFGSEPAWGISGCRFRCQPNCDPRTAAGSSSRELNEACGCCRPHRYPEISSRRRRSLVGRRINRLEFQRRRAATRKLRRKPAKLARKPERRSRSEALCPIDFPTDWREVAAKAEGRYVSASRTSASDHARHQPPRVLGA